MSFEKGKFFECSICYEHKTLPHKLLLDCGHFLCRSCFEEVTKRSDKCPYCRASIEEKIEEDPESWLYLDPRDWIIYSRVDKKEGEEKIYTRKKSHQEDTWRNDEMLVVVKRNRQRKKRLRNRYS